MMKNNTWLLALLAFHLSLFTPMSAQDKLFSLEDLNYGGNNYHRMQPKDLFLTWWGEKLVNTDVEECYLIDKSYSSPLMISTPGQRATT